MTNQYSIKWPQEVGGGGTIACTLGACVTTKPHTLHYITPMPLFKGWVDLFIS